MKWKKSNFNSMKPLLALLLVIVSFKPCFSQATDSLPSRGDTLRRNPHGSVVHIVLAEVIIGGISYYAASPQAYGDVKTQTVGVLNRTKAILEGLGLTMADVIKMQVFLVHDARAPSSWVTPSVAR